jgi:hypothetical protein
VILRQPIAQTRRHQQDLLTLTRQEVLGHHRIVLRPPDDPALCATATDESGNGGGAASREIEQRQRSDGGVERQ